MSLHVSTLMARTRCSLALRRASLETTTATTPESVEVPYGKCHCLCGGNTNLATRTDPRYGWIKGEPVRFIRGHNRRKRSRYIVVDMDYESACWLWLLAKGKDGYGKVSDSTGRTVLAHRFYYERKIGPVPHGLQLDHLCRMRACVNPTHLEAVTAKENIRRGDGTRLTSTAVAEIRAS